MGGEIQLALCQRNRCALTSPSSLDYSYDSAIVQNLARDYRFSDGHARGHLPPFSRVRVPLHRPNPTRMASKYFVESGEKALITGNLIRETILNEAGIGSHLEILTFFFISTKFIFIGMLVYFLYGYHNSIEGNKPNSIELEFETLPGIPIIETSTHQTQYQPTVPTE